MTRDSRQVIWSLLVAMTSLVGPAVVAVGPAAAQVTRSTEAKAADARQADDKLTAQVDAACQRVMAEQKLVGLAVALIQDGEVTYVKGYGFEDREAGTPVTDQTMFRWASISKPVTAILAMQLVNAGKLDLSADVRSLVEDYPEQTFSGKPVTVTIRDLLCHQGGIVHYTNGPVIPRERAYDTKYPFADVVVALDKFANSPLVNAPGEAYSYSTHGYMLLGAAVQVAGQEKFADQARKRVFEPLGMSTMQPDYQWVAIPHRAVGYRLRNGEPVRSTDTDVSWKLAGGGFISTVGDLARFGAGLMTEKLVPEETLDQMWTRQKNSAGQETGYGLGFVTERFARLPLVSHTGSQEKTKTAMFLRPESKNGVVLMCNSENAQLPPLSREILQMLSDPPK